MTQALHPVIKYRKDYLPSQFLISQTQLRFQLFDEYTYVYAQLDFYRNPKDPRNTLEPLVLDGVGLELIEIFVDQHRLEDTDYLLNAETLTLLKTSDSFTLRTKVKVYPNKNTSLEGLYMSKGKFCTQCEAEGFRKITYYLDRPEVMAQFNVRVEGAYKNYPLLLSNGNQVNQGELSNGRHFVEWHDPFPKPSYLFALVAGDLDCLQDQFVTMSGRQIQLQLYVDKGKLDQCQFAMDSLKASMAWDEQKYGREYDLDLYMIVAVGDFNMGAMENKGLNIFNTVYVLANQKTATDADFEGVERVIAHEYFHNWTGNRVTCRDWFQLSLKEGLTVFRDQQFSEDMQSYAVERIDQVKIIRAAQFAEDSGPMAHPIRPDSYIEMNNFYTVTVYNKGAEVIRMMHTLLGEQGFRRGMDLYFQRHDGQAVTCEDFIKAMEDANQQDWRLFRNWYCQAGTPKLDVDFNPLSADRYELIFQQSCPPSPGQSEKQPFMIPVKLGFLTEQGESAEFICPKTGVLTQESLLVVSQAGQRFEIQFKSAISPGKKLIPSLLRDFSAPVKLSYPYSAQDLALLFAFDPNPFNRWDAGQNLMTQLLLSQEKTLEQQDLSRVHQAIGLILDDENLDNSLKSLAVQMPSLSSLIGQAETIDLDQLFNKYRQLRQHIGQALEPKWFSLYNTLPGDNSANRKLRNTALYYMMQADASKHFELAAKQQTHASNMSDELAALQVIASSTETSRSQYIQDFYQKWKNEDLVMDKWFSAQVIQDDETVIAQVSALMRHEKFTLTNPNKVRALVGAFAANNLFQFHNPNGQGYELLASIVIQLNQLNPQIASRMAKQFNQWKKFDIKRQALIREQLEKIKLTPNLSNDVYEVVEKSLAL